jgi:orotidine-5'-phosphate decarboxylase
MTPGEPSQFRQISARDRMIVALDLPTPQAARALVHDLGESVRFYKVGMELVYAGGLDLVKDLIAEGKKVFVDLKLHDIPNTVERAAAQIARLGATFLTVHAFPQTMKAAKIGVAGSGLQILAVTVMTSYDDDDLIEAGYACTVKELVARRAAQAKQIGIDGLILSPEELAATRAQLGSDILLITPGIRPAQAAHGDQKRVMTPQQAIADGADYLVIGRPVTQAEDPRASANAIVAEIEEALQK